MTNYRHVQTGYALLVVYGALVSTALILVAITGFSPVFIGPLLVLGIGMAMFASLTITVSDTVILAEFYLGFPRRTIKISEIYAISIVRNRWYYGLGVRFTPHGWLFAVSGLSAIEFEMRSGKRFRIGTDEPERLAQAIESARGLDSGN